MVTRNLKSTGCLHNHTLCMDQQKTASDCSNAPPKHCLAMVTILDFLLQPRSSSCMIKKNFGIALNHTVSHIECNLLPAVYLTMPNFHFTTQRRSSKGLLSIVQKGMTLFYFKVVTSANSCMLFSPCLNLLK